MRRRPLILTVVVLLILTAFLPLGIARYMLGETSDARFDQVRRVHILAATSASEKVGAHVEALRDVIRSTTSHPVFAENARSATAQELFRGFMQFQPEIHAAGLYTASGESVLVASRPGFDGELDPGVLGAGENGASVLVGATKRWMRIQESVADGQGIFVAIAEADFLDELVRTEDLSALQQILVAPSGQVLAGTLGVTLGSFPDDLVERAMSGKFKAEGNHYADPVAGDQMVGYAPIEDLDWFVLTREPLEKAEAEKARVQRAGRWSIGAALMIAMVLTGFSWVTVIRPLQRLVNVQKDLLGADLDVAGSEIAQLEKSFEILQQRIQESEELGEVFLGRFQVKQLIGSGAMGSVFKGWDPRLQRSVALKTIRLNTEEIDQDKLMGKLREEAAISARFNHPNIVTVYDLEESGRAAFMAMEYVKGVSLDAYLWERVTLEPEEVIPLGLAIARGLATAHEHDLVHHDVKPGNVLLGVDHSVKVTDFGISQLITSAARTADVVCGTPGYLAPECLQGEGYTPKSDLFSLGIILYESLAGRHPFFGRTFRETVINTIVEDVKPIEVINARVPSELAELIAELLSKKPKDRPRDAQEVVDRLQEMARAEQLEWMLPAGTLEGLGKVQGTRTETQLFSLEDTKLDMAGKTAVATVVDQRVG